MSNLAAISSSQEARYISLKLSLVGNPFYFSSKSHLQHYFDYHVCLSICSFIVRAPKVPGVNPWGWGVIQRRFKRKKIFVTYERTDGRTDRRDSRNSVVDIGQKV